jgi:PAT family beta-lactamase induction signal transducer AmpG
MIDITKKSHLKSLLFGNLYFSEGILLTLASVIVPIYLLDNGVSIALATLIAGLTAAPWYIKFAIGPIIDHYYSIGKKPFIITGGIIGGTGLLFIILIDPFTLLIPFTLVLFLSHLGIVFLDVSCDGWVIQISKDNERGKINGAMTAGLFAGMIFASSVLAPIAEIYGYNICFFVAGVAMLITLIFALVVREQKISKRTEKISFLLKKEFKKRTVQLISLYSSVQGIGFGLLIFAIPLYLKTILQLNIGQIGLVMSVYPLTLVIGSLIGGTLADKWGRKIVLYVFMSISIVFSAALIYANTWQIVAIIYGIIGFLQGGGLYAAGCALLMDNCNPKIGATQYSIYASITNFSEFGMGSISGSLVTILGYSRLFLYSAWSLGPVLIILYFIKTKRNRKKQ